MGALAFLEGGGEMGERMAAFDWSATPLGPIEAWPQSLKTATGLLLRSPAPIVMLWGEDGIMIYNDAYSVFAGQRHPQLLGSKVREGWPEVADFNDNIMKVGLAGGTLSYKDQELMLNRRGMLEKAWLDLEYSPVPDESGKPAGVIALVFETTDRVLADQRVQSERDRLWQMFEQAPGFICTMRGPDHVYEFVNAAHRRLFGSSDWIGKPLREAFPDLEGQGFYELMDRVYATGERYVANGVPVRFGSSRDEAPTDRLLDFVYEPMLDEAGQVSGIFCEGYDVTDRLAAEQAMRRSENRLRALVNASANLTYQMNADWTQIRLLDRDGRGDTTMPSAVWGDEHIHPSDREAVREVIRAAVDSRSMFELEHRVRLDDGRWGWTLSRAVPILDEQGEIVEWFGAASDVTERRTAQAALQQSESRLRLALDVAAMGTMIWHVEEDRTDADDQMLALFGLSPTGQVSPATVLRNLVHPNDLQRHMDGVARACDPAGEGVLREDIRVIQPGGAVRWLAINGQVEFAGEPRRAVRMVAAAIDITQRKATEAALRESEDRLRFLDSLGRETAKLTEANAILRATTRLVGQYLGVSICAYADMDEDQDGFTIRGDWAAPGSASIVGHYQLKDFGRLAVANLSQGQPLIVNDNHEELAPHEAATFQSIGIAATICMPLVKDGKLTALMAIHDKSPRVWTVGELAVIGEVTERSWAHIQRAAAEADLRESEARYRTLFESIDEGFMIIEQLPRDGQGRRDYRYLVMNPAAQAMFGNPDMTGQTIRANFPDEDGFWCEMFDQVVESGKAVRFEHGSQPQGMVLEMFLSRLGEHGSNRLMVVMQDVTQRRRAEQALRELNEQLEERVAEALAERRLLADIVEGTDAFVQVADLDFRWLAINKASADEFERIFGRRPKVGDNMLDLLADRPDHQAAVRAVWQRALNGESFTEIQAFGDPSLDRRTYEMRFGVLRDPDGAQVGAYQFVYDVTERLREQARLAEAEAALHQAQKMETVGQLTGGVAHDFNNLLTPIVGALDVLKRKVAGDERAERLAGGAQQAADRARVLVQRLLAFSRRAHLTPQAVDVGLLIENMAELVSRSIGPRIRLELRVAPDMPPAHIDPNQLELALLNLAVNARDAMPDGGLLVMAAETLEGDMGGRIASGRYVRITVTDTGAGMDEATLKRAADPFFTTKEVGRGTGLGLSSVQGLVEQSGGGFELVSALGEGTSAILWLPVSDQTPAPGPVRAESESHAVSGARVLLVDDEELVRTGAAEMLVQAGYKVTQAAGAAQALDLLGAGLETDILVTDYAMPGVTGAELGRQAATLRPGLPVLMITGYADLGDREAGDLPRLAKPFSQAELAAAVAGLLEGPGER